MLGARTPMFITPGSSSVIPPEPRTKPTDDVKRRIRAVLTKYQRPSTARALWQIFNTIVPYVLLWFLMYYVKEISLWLTIPLAVLAGTLLVRVFIFFHD